MKARSLPAIEGPSLVKANEFERLVRIIIDPCLLLDHVYRKGRCVLYVYSILTPTLLNYDTELYEIL